jgi:hypothetical protein
MFYLSVYKHHVPYPQSISQLSSPVPAMGYTVFPEVNNATLSKYSLHFVLVYLHDLFKNYMDLFYNVHFLPKI